MAVDNVNVIDGMAIDSENNALRLLLADHLTWKLENEHLLLLQDKINAYISFLESKQYKQTYQDADFDMAVIEIHFKYEITDNCGKFLQVVQDQVGQYGIKIEAHIG